MSRSAVPKKAQILVLGGGPAGSYTACMLALEGFDVVLLEAAKFPRYHIGESMLPSCPQFLKLIDLEETVENFGFCNKPGAALKLVGEKKEAYTDFIRTHPENRSWNVTRADFDEILLRHAEKVGVKVFEETRAFSIKFVNDNPKGRPLAVKWQNIIDRNVSGTVSFEYLVDATGRDGIMAQKYLKHRKVNTSLRNVACWGYWKGAGVYGVGTSRENAPWFEAHTEESGWNWFIPLHNGMTSVGVVINEDAGNQRKLAAKRANGGVASTLKRHYLDCLQLSPGLIDLLGDAKLLEDGPYPVVQSASDFSYNAPTYSGDHYRLIGDAAAFIDPFFSSGVHLALTGGLAAAVSIASSIRGEYSETEGCKYHDAKIGVAYTRFLVVVLSAYKQMRAQNRSVLSDFDEDNFDRAFDIIRPVIQGDADVGRRMSEDELQKLIALCGSALLPVDPEVYARVVSRLDTKLVDPRGAIVTPEEIDLLVPNDLEARLVLKEINARKSTGGLFLTISDSFEEVTAGFSARVHRGNIGLISHAPKANSTSGFSIQVGKARPSHLPHLLLLFFGVVLALLFHQYGTFGVV
ncbi:hypothetical protein PILCRDRAFT_547145 [Piloderma croceum F 1598]|uniref:FAD-binding domain-containing protein n=1 Tax=Piloderma croceum (strain F 1598) TaxID=765440 RepID=A0A0C3FK19_PILCF|nr:hypothetical protein PILCRDRAFT_547145 [Piloderma croceum F 1598]